MRGPQLSGYGKGPNYKINKVTIMLVFAVLGNNSVKSQYIHRLMIPVLPNNFLLCLLCPRGLAQVFFPLLITHKWNALKECYFT